MIDWLKNINKKHPDFWKNYLSKFESKSDQIIAFSIETSGMDPDKDVIVSFGGFKIQDNSILIGKSFEKIVVQDNQSEIDTLFNTPITGAVNNRLTEKEAIEQFIDYIGNSILVGHHIDFQVEMINEALEKQDCGRLKNLTFDIGVIYNKINEINDKKFTLDELCNLHKIPRNDRNSSSEDGYRIGLLFLKLKNKMDFNF